MSRFLRRAASIVIQGKSPKKLDYLTTDKGLDLTDAAIRIKYEGRDENAVPMTEDMQTYSLTGGTQSVTVTYGDCSTSFDINVSKAQPILSAKDTIDIEGDQAFMLDVDYTGDGKISYKTDSSLIKVTSTGRIITLSSGVATVVIGAPETDKYQAISKTVTINVLKAKTDSNSADDSQSTVLYRKSQLQSSCRKMR